jgi:hypothetical protein
MGRIDEKLEALEIEGVRILNPAAVQAVKKIFIEDLMDLSHEYTLMPGAIWFERFIESLHEYPKDCAGKSWLPQTIQAAAHNASGIAD